ncbi:MAG: polysaccharide deacetylase family protein [Candidatus Omnitrophica bacterium]|nr:polysaccharide deacetylase family protein [Candidatus Omnitrophota bacterium]
MSRSRTKQINSKQLLTRPEQRVSGSPLRPQYLPSPERDPFKMRMRFGREVFYGVLASAVTLMACVAMIYLAGQTSLAEFRTGNYWGSASAALLVSFFLFLVYGNMVYLVNRSSYFYRLKSHHPPSRQEMEGIYENPEAAPEVTYLIPSYKEERRVNCQSVFSAFLQDYPKRRIVLLVDDPPRPSDSESVRQLKEARSLPGDIKTWCSPMRDQLSAARSEFESRALRTELDSTMECLRLADLHADVADFLEKFVEDYPIEDHTDWHFVQLVFGSHIKDHRRRAHEFFLKGVGYPAEGWQRLVRREFTRLSSLFSASLEVFERKTYENFSWAPNKAMNLNSYLFMMGRHFREVIRGSKVFLEPAHKHEATLSIPDAKYVVNLDADSTLAPEYTLKLVHEMEKPENDRVAVMQTPYTSIPNAATALERVAGATTDMQYVVQQGFTAFGAASWVGANTLLRKSALNDIVTVESERGHLVAKFIQDRTVIEDTESTIDLIDCGWKLHNYPERLSYSATPPDFGALVIQRCRWANGGLIVLPKMLRYWLKGPFSLKKLMEGFLRFHYLTNALTATLGYMVLIFLPLREYVYLAWLLPLAGLPYYVIYMRDMHLARHRLSDFFRAFAMNLLLAPVNMVGVLKSVEQMITGKQSPFMRTPKILGRTASPAPIALVELSLVVYCTLITVILGFRGEWGNAVVPCVHAFIFAYAIKAFIGFRASAEDINAGFFQGGAGAKKASNRGGRMKRRILKIVAPGSAAVALIVLIFVVQGFGSGPVPAAILTPAKQVPVLMYHKVSPDPAEEANHTLVHLDRFKEEMRYLKENGYTTVTVSELSEYLRGDRVLPDKSVALTFDDGWKSVMNAVEILEEYDFKATFFFVQEYVDNQYPAFLSSSEIDRIVANKNFEIGSHSMTHPWEVGNNLVSWISGENEGRSSRDCAVEVAAPKFSLEKKLHRDIAVYAWPSGWYNDRLLTLARNAGYTATVTTDVASNRPGDDPMKIRRYPVWGQFEMPEFKRLLQGEENLDSVSAMVRAKIPVPEPSPAQDDYPES